MKRIAIVGTCLLTMAAGLSAQTALLKTSKQALHGARDYAAYTAAVEALSPAFTDPATANSAETYFIPGEAGFKLYDNYLVAVQYGNQINPTDMGNALMDGYRFFLKAFPLDSLPNEKGQVKPKYSKKMIDMIAGHVNDFDNAAKGYWQEHNYPAAYDAWEACLSVSEDPRYAKTGIVARPDSVIAMFRFNQACAAWQGGILDKAIASFRKAIDLGNTDPLTYEYAFSVANQAKDSVNANQFLEEAIQRFGTDEPKFLLLKVNSYIENKDYENAATLLSDAVAKDPNNSFFYFSYGVLNESLGKKDEAAENYRKSIDLNPELPQAQFGMGRVLTDKYNELDEKAANMTQAEYNKYAAEVLRPMLRESAKYFEKAYQLDSDNTAPLQYLRSIYYNLDDGDNLKRIEDLLKY